ncbi:MAG TPA: outer membrane beta-barrel protein [Blastocatellia bacterium]|nr:outer membrane beta-barrel protein [Blastocatellia bacterium]
MRRVLLAAAALFLVSATAQAQEEYPRMEIFGGYAYFNSDQFVERESLNAPAFIVSGAGNISGGFGLVAEVNGNYGDVTIPNPGPTREFATNTYTFLFGPRFTSRQTGKNFFGHVLFGAARTSVDGFDSETDFAMAVGGGLDINASKEIAVRLFQADYLPIFVSGDTAHNYRISFGIVFRFGAK